MTLVNKIAITLLCASGAVVLVYSYFWAVRRDYYFPGRYEDAYQAIALTVLASILAVAWVISSHVMRRRKM